MKSSSFSLTVTILLPIMLSPYATAHHSFSRFDMGKIIEIEGELVEYRWRNPHIRMKVSGVNEAGENVVWDIEGHSLSILRRTNASPEGLEEGDRVRIAGWPTVRPSSEIFVHNMLLPDGRELVLGPEGSPRWSGGNAIGDKTEWLTDGSSSDSSGRDGLFRVWSTYLGEGATFRKFWRREYPLTATGRERLAEFDPLTDTTAPGCSPKGMPMIMEQPYPLEFLRDGDNIVLRLEEYDTVRTIHMGETGSPAGPNHSLLGYSTGRWDGDTLVVATDKIDFPYLDPAGTPLGSDPELLERFRVSEDGSRLLYELTVTDEEIFTEPVNLARDWVWRPGETVEPYECDQSQ